ncbi:MAG: YlmH/Sll1252 family protein [Oscillospiraceae bacterium]|nr:YlmH/Sll1252 family protein [Oscillospiraceae bacterium]
MIGDSNILIARMDDLATKAIKIGVAASKFLTPADATNVVEHFTHRRDVSLCFYGGFDGAERTRAIFTNPDWGECERTKLFTALKISYRVQDTLGHRDILGALMALGIKREALGDIVVDESFSLFICLPEMATFITENFTKAGRVGLQISQVGLDEIPDCEEDLTIKTCTVASLRLDAVLSAAFGVSRTKATELIATKQVSLNHQICEKNDREVGENSLLSVRGMGRVKLLEIGGISRKGRSFIKVGIYER